MFYVKCYGGSCDYYLAKPNGSTTLNLTEAWGFETEGEARQVAGDLYSKGFLSHWEVREFRREPAEESYFRVDR